MNVSIASQPNHMYATVHPAEIWVPDNKDRSSIVDGRFWQLIL